MTTIDFLLDLQQKHTFYKNGLNDLETFIDIFDNAEISLIENAFTKKLNLNIDQFLVQLQEDLERVGENEVTKLADIVENYIYTKKNRLLDCINKAIYHYGIKYPEFDTQKYFKSFVLGIVSDIQEDLYSNVVVYFEDTTKNKNTLAENQAGYGNQNDTHDLIIYTHSFKKQSEKRIFEILRTLYHEEFHMLVDEMQINPNCFKLDILEYQKVETFRAITKNGSNFYNNYYAYIQEEANAEIYGTQKAYKKIKELNPSFPFSKIKVAKYTSLLWSNISQLATKYKISLFKRVEHKKIVEEILDHLLPKKPDFVYGMLSKIYDEKGYRKSFKILVEEFKTASENKNVPIEEIEEFYTEILYDAYLKSSEQEKLEITQDDFLGSILLQCLKKKQSQIESEIKKLNQEKATSLMETLKRKYKTHFLLDELVQVENELKIFDRKDSNIYGL